MALLVMGGVAQRLQPGVATSTLLPKALLAPKALLFREAASGARADGTGDS